MTVRWRFQRREDSVAAIDATTIRRRLLVELTQSDIEHMPLNADGHNVALGELFDVVVNGSGEGISFQGDLSNVHGLGCRHDAGDFRVEGSVGTYFGSGALGGSIVVEGNAGDFVGSPLSGRRVGICGATIEIRGSVGTHAGHRMRRGLLMVGGDSGYGLAGSMIAGTIAVSGQASNGIGIGMKRGTVLLSSPPDGLNRESSPSYSEAHLFDAGFLSLYRAPAIRGVINTGVLERGMRCRADVSIGGQGEILFPTDTI